MLLLASRTQLGSGRAVDPTVRGQICLCHQTLPQTRLARPDNLADSPRSPTSYGMYHRIPIVSTRLAMKLCRFDPVPAPGLALGPFAYIFGGRCRSGRV